MAKRNSRSTRKDGLNQVVNSYRTQLEAGKQVGDAFQNAGGAVEALGKGKPLTAVGKGINAVVSGVKGVVNSFKGVGEHLVGIGKILFNHPQWYLNYDAGSMINANYGINRTVRDIALDGSSSIAPASVAGLVTRLDIPITQARDWQQGINILYNNIRSANGGAINYTVYDLERYILTVRTMHAAYYTARRAYATLRNINRYDASTPISLFAAMGLDYVTFSQNAANLKMFGNKLSNIISNLYPIKLDLIDRTDWLFSNFIADSNDAKHALYVFAASYNVDYFLPGASSAGTVALGSTSTSLSSTGLSFSNFESGINTFMGACAANNTMHVIAGDILKAFGSNAVMPTEIWADDAIVPEVYDEAALQQIQNATIYPVTQTYTLSATDFITVNMAHTAAAAIAYLADRSQKGVINMYKDSVTPGDTLSATRLMLVLSNNTPSSGSPTNTVISCGTEHISQIRFVANAGTALTFGGLTIQGYDGTVQSTPAQVSIISWIMSQFNYHPCYIFSVVANTQYLQFDLNNYALAGGNNIDAFHGYAVLSLLASPRMIKLSRTDLIKK